MSTEPTANATVAGTKGFFPDQNPNPVLRLEADGRLSYANAAAAPILEAWSVAVGDRFDAALADRLHRAAAEQPPGTVEVEQGAATFSILAIYVPELNAWNL